MSFETTLTCDGCSKVWDGGTRESVTEELRDQGGRAFRREERNGPLTELRADQDWRRSVRHLAPCCVDATEFFDGKPVPAGGKDQ